MSNSPYNTAFLRIMGVGFIVIVGYIITDSYFTSREYPEPRFDDTLTDQEVSSIKNNRGASYVEFHDRTKIKLPSSQNFNYDDGFRSIAEVLANGDIISKMAGTDTVKIRHQGKEYVFVLGQVIRKSNKP